MMKGEGVTPPKHPERKTMWSEMDKPIETDKFKRSRRQRLEQVFAFYVDYAVKHMGHTPTFKEVMAACDIPSTSMVRSVLDSLISQKKLRYMDGFIVIPGSLFAWNENTPGGAVRVSVSSQDRAVELRADGDAGVQSGGGDRPLVPTGGHARGLD